MTYTGFLCFLLGLGFGMISIAIIEVYCHYSNSINPNEIFRFSLLWPLRKIHSRYLTRRFHVSEQSMDKFFRVWGNRHPYNDYKLLSEERFLKIHKKTKEQYRNEVFNARGIKT